jgi:hypothetical protein
VAESFSLLNFSFQEGIALNLENTTSSADGRYFREV